MSQSKRQDIQLLRAIAIIAVVLIHTCPNGMYQVWCRPFINFAVALFLFLSGYLTKEKYDHWHTVMWRRISRVLIPYLLWTIIYSMPPVLSPTLLLTNIVTSNAAAHLYFIPVYIQLVLLTPLIVKLARSRYKHLGWLITPLSYLLFNYPQYCPSAHINGYVIMANDISCLNWFTFYYLGIVMGNGIIKCERSHYITSAVLLFSIMLQLIEGYVFYRQGLSNCGTQLKLTSLFTSTVTCILAYNLMINRDLKATNKLLLTIGNYSFGIYLSHILFIRLAKCMGVYDSIPYVINSAIVLALSAVFCIACDKVLAPKIVKWIGIK